jgi:actin-related protein
MCVQNLYQNVVLCGGLSLHSGFSDRLQSACTPVWSPKRSKVVAPPERKYSVWIGGSILASLSTMQKLWITREEYEEVGPEIVRKCRFT